MSSSSSISTSSSRIPSDIIDEPTQRIYLTTLLILIQSRKLLDFLKFISNLTDDSIFLPLILNEFINWLLIKWIIIDLIFLSFVKWLKVDRLEFDRNRYFILISCFILFNFGLFGQWKFTSFTFFIPTSLSSIFIRSLSVGEVSVRLASVLGSESDFLSGRVDVHLLSPSTAHLNPFSNNYCIPFSTSSNSEPIFIPLFLNNTTPSKITYNLTSLTLPYITKSYTIPASALKSHKSLTSSSSPSSTSTNSNDSKILVRQSSSSSHHSSSSIKPSSNLEIYHLPINQPGIIHLHEIIDQENRSIKIKRSRATLSSSSSSNLGPVNKWEGVRISTCPRAGFAHLPSTGEVINKCLSKSYLDQSIDLNLRVAGEEPLSLTWHSLNFDTGRRSKEVVLNGIRSARQEEKEEEDGFIKVPFNISLSEVGRYKYFIDSITDIYNNKIESDHDNPSISSSFESTSSSPKKKIFSSSSSSSTISKSTYSDSKEIIIHSPPQVSFIGLCGRSESVKLLKRSNKKAVLEIRLTGSEGEEWNVRFRFTPENIHNSSRDSRMIELNSRRDLLRFEVEEAGLYELMEVNGKFCKGIVLSPSECTVFSPQIPTLQSTFTPILDSCQSEIGTTIDLTLTGSPPFTIYYSQQSLSPYSTRPTIKSLKILNTRHSFEIKPDPGFEWEYKLLGIEDSNYSKIDLDSSSGSSEYEFRQNIPMIGGAEFRNPNERIRKVFTCQGEMVDVDVVLKGQPPYELEYAISSPSSSGTTNSQFLSNLLTTSQTLHIPIPESISHNNKGGEFTISLRSLKDGNGCKRLLKVEDLIIQVKRNRPSATLIGGIHDRELVIKEGEDVRIPIRLTGEAPWSIEYESPVTSTSRKQESSKERHIIRSNHPNFELELSYPLPGSYKLISIKDSHCPGDILDSEWKIDHLPRPTLRLRDGFGEVGTNARKGVCAGVVDKVGISFRGTSPFTASYSVSNRKHLSKDTTKTLQSIQPESELILETDHPGRHVYTITGVADSLYTSLSNQGLSEPTGGNVIQFEQEVFSIPIASFRHSQKSRAAYCINEKLVSRSDDLLVNLDGQPPFELEFEIRRDEISERFIIPNIQTKSFPVNLPFTFTTDSPHVITIKRISDANSCERLLDPTTSSDTSIILNVAKTATIVPLQAQIDHCVGEFLEFNLQGGSPPFTVTYEFNSKRHVVPLSTTTFTRLATTPGRFEIVSVGHGEDQCKSSERLGLIKEVHSIPSVQIDDGNLVIVDLREGEQTEIIFTFVGTPPFTFTYSRQHPQDRSNDKTILETQTISGIMDHSYSIFSFQEGTWTVSAIEDKYCSYPLRKTSSLKLLTST